MPTPFRVLLVEDDPSYAELVQLTLHRSALATFEVERHATLAAALARVAEFAPDAVVLDLNLPDSSGLETVCAMVGRVGRAAVVVLTGDEKDETSIEVMRRGADDFLVKDRYRALVRTIRHAVERRRAAEELRATQESFRALFHSGHDAAFVCSRDAVPGALLEVNDRACALLGYGRDELIALPPTAWGGDLADLAAPDTAALSPSPRQNGVVVGECDLRTKCGGRVPVEAVVQTLVFRGRPVSLILARDLSERKRAEAEKDALQQQLFEAQKREAVGRVAAGVAQDVNNALTVIVASCSLAKGSLPSDDPVHEDLDEIVAASERASHLVEQLVSFARKQVIRPETFALADALRALAPSLRVLVGDAVTLDFSLRGEGSTISVDRAQLELALQHVVRNAREATQPGGRIRVETTARGTDEFGLVCLSVSDEGAGMTPDVERRAFEPFFSTKGAGATGLGLSMVQGMVAQAGGHAALDTQPGRGTTVRLLFPSAGRARPAPPSPPRDGSAIRPPTAARRHVLVCDDDPRVRRAAVRVLRRSGFGVSETGSGGEALTLLGDPSARVDVLLTDVVMPGMNGRELAERARAIRPVEVVFMSGFSEETISRQGVLEDGVRLLAKPFDAEALVAAVSGA